VVDDIDEDDTPLSPEMEKLLERIKPRLKEIAARKKEFKDAVDEYVEEKTGDGSVQLDEIESAIINVKVAVAEEEEFPAWDDVEFLVESEDPRAIEMFIESINDKWPAAGRLQLEAIEALGNTGGILEEEAIKALGRSLAWGNHSGSASRGPKRYAAKSALALGKFNTPSAVDLLLRAFVHSSMKDEGETRRAITQSLGEIAERRGDDEALAESLASTVEPLIESLGDNEFSGSNRQPWEGPIGALGHIGDGRAVGPLISLMEESEDMGLKGEIAESLGRIGGDQVFKAIVKAIGPDLRYTERGEIGFISGLGYLGDRRATPLLINWLEYLVHLRDGRADGIRGWHFQFAIGSLGKIGDGEAVVPILHAYAAEQGRLIDLSDKRGGSSGARERAMKNNREVAENALVSIGEDGREILTGLSDGLYSDTFSEIEDPEFTHEEYEELRNRQNNLIREIIRDVLDSIESPR